MPAPWLEPVDLTPETYELQVVAHLRQSGAGLLEFTVTHRDAVEGEEGEYIIDAVARFEALGADFQVLVECKLTKRPVEREVVQVLHDKVRSTGTHKGMIFSNAGFQKGALEYANAHGIATIQFADGRSAVLTRARPGNEPQPPPRGPDAYVSWIVKPTETGESHSLMRDRREAFLEAFRTSAGNGEPT